MNLYKITLKNNIDYYVVAEDTESAYRKLRKILNDENLYFTSERKLKCIELVADTFYEKDVFVENN